METSLDRIQPGKQAVIVQMNMEQALKTRLRCFGLVPGTVVCCRYRSPGGKVSALAFRGTVVALRTADLKKIRVRC